MAGGRSPSGTVLLLRQCLACERDSIFAVFSAVGAGVAMRHYVPGSNDGLGFHAMCILQEEPTPENHNGLRIQLF
jgi:hypothetical protein